MRKKIVSVILTFALAVSLAACGSAEKEKESGKEEVKIENGEVTEAKQEENAGDDLPVIKVAVMPFLCSLPTEYMVENGLDVANGFKIETVYFANGGAMNEALGAEQWEVGPLSAAAVNALAIYGAYEIADVGHSEGGLYTLVAADSPIAQIKGYNPSYPDIYGDPDSVRGKVIATNTGTIAHLNANKWLESIGLTSEDVEIVNMDFPSAYQALKTGNCDIAALNPPTSYTAEAEGYVVTSDLAKLGVPQFDTIVASNKAYTERRDLLVDYLKAYFQATDALQADTEMAAKMLYDWYVENGSETSMEACATEIETRPFVTSEEARGIKIGEAVEITGEFWVSQGLLEESRYPEIATHIDDSILKEALGF